MLLLAVENPSRIQALLGVASAVSFQKPLTYTEDTEIKKVRRAWRPLGAVVRIFASDLDSNHVLGQYLPSIGNIGIGIILVTRTGPILAFYW